MVFANPAQLYKQTNMKRAILLILLVLSAVGYSQTPGKDKTKQVTSDKAVATEKQRQSPDKSKSGVPENLKSFIDKIKPNTRDTIKATAAIAPEIIQEGDSAIIAKGKFRVYKKDVHASYYHNKFNGKKTASGKKFSNKGYTAAHRKLPFGTIVRITNEENGKSVIVEVTDRGPFSRGREIDLTNRAFMEIASNKNSGSMSVKIEVMD